MLGKNNSTCETSWKKKVWAGVICFACDQNNKRFQTILFFLEIFLFIHVWQKIKYGEKNVVSCLKHDFVSLTCDRGKNKVLAEELFLLKGSLFIFFSFTQKRVSFQIAQHHTHRDFLFHIFTDRLFVNADDAEKWFNFPSWKPNKHYHEDRFRESRAQLVFISPHTRASDRETNRCCRQTDVHINCVYLCVCDCPEFQLWTSPTPRATSVSLRRSPLERRNAARRGLSTPDVLDLSDELKLKNMSSVYYY